MKVSQLSITFDLVSFTLIPLLVLHFFVLPSFLLLFVSEEVFLLFRWACSVQGCAGVILFPHSGTTLPWVCCCTALVLCSGTSFQVALFYTSFSFFVVPCADDGSASPFPLLVFSISSLSFVVAALFVAGGVLHLSFLSCCSFLALSS